MKTRRIISFILALVLVTALLPTAALAYEIDGDWDYSVSDNKATVTHYNGAGGDVEIPATLGGCPVTGIGDFAFNCCYDLTSVTIPSCVESIGDDAFAFCYALTSVTIPSGVTGIGDGAFSYCYVLKDLRFLGSRAQFYAILKGEAWDFCMGQNVGGYTIHFNAVPTEVSTWEDLQAALSAGGDIVLTADVTPENPYWADALTVNSGVVAALDLNGHTVNRGYTEQGFDGSVIKIYGTLTVTDSASGGSITGGFPDQYGGGVYISGGTFNLLGGSITGNSVGKTGFFGSEGLGGGVYLQSGTFNMSGGAITGNKALGSSMGSSLGRGGGVYVNGGTFTMSGGTVSGNEAGRCGGGVYLASEYSGHSGSLVSGGATVTGNAVGGADNNVYLEDGGVLAVSSSLTGTVSVTMQTPGVFTSGWKDKMGETADPAEYFTSDDAGLAVFLTDAGEAQIGVEEYPLWVGGVQVDSANKGDILGDGTASFDPDTTTLTLTNANITATSSYQYNGVFTYSSVIYARGLDLTVSLSGNNTVGDGSADDAITSDEGTLAITGGCLTAAGSDVAIYAEKGISITGSTVTATSSGSYYSDGIYADGAVTITDSTVTATGDRSGINAIQDVITVSGDSIVTAQGGRDVAIYAPYGVTLNDGLAYVEGEATAKKAVIGLPTYTVTVTPGANMMIAAGAASQTVRAGDAMERVIYMASEGYYFPEDYAVTSVNGVAVMRDSFTRITVFGTPTGNVEITLPDPTAKAKEPTPTATFTAAGPDTGTLTGVTAGMTYAIDGGAAIAITGERIDLTGLAPCTITVIQPGNGTTTIDSEAQSIDVTRAETPNLAVTQPTTIGGRGVVETTEAHEWSSNTYDWEDCSVSQDWPQDCTIFIRVKASGTVLASAYQTVTINAFVPEKEPTPAAVFTATGADTGTLSNVAAGMKYKIGGGEWQTVNGTSVDLTNLAPCTVTVYMPGNGATTVDSDDQTITVTKAEAPALTAAQLTSVGGKGSIPTAAEHEFSTDGTTWTACTGETTGLVTDTYYVRVKAVDTVLASDAQEIVIIAPGSVAFSGRVTLNGRPMTAGDVFTFEVYKDGSVIATAQSDATGNIDFTEINYFFSDVGQHSYTVKQSATTLTGVTIDGREYTVDVIVTYNPGDAALTVTPSDNFTGLFFTNTYDKQTPPEDTKNYSAVTVPLTVSVTKAGRSSADLTEDEKPKAVENLIEDVFEQALVTAPEKLPEGYTGIEYSTDGENWSGTLPTGKKAGEYTVQIKYIGDANHEDFSGDPVAVTILKAVYAFALAEGEDLKVTKGSGKELTATVVQTGAEDTSFEHFACVYIGEAELQRGVDYTVKKGSTVVTILPAALDKLDFGNHTLTIRFTNGEASAQFTVLAANSGDAVSPQTGDNSHIGLWIILMTVSAIAATSLIVIVKRKRILGK